MTCRSGEGSPTSPCDAAAANSHEEVETSKPSVASIRPTVRFEQDVCSPCASGVRTRLLAPLDDDENGETFMERCDRLDAEDAERVVDGDAVVSGETAEDDDILRDDDGAIIFDGGVGESRELRLPPGVVTPSKEMVRMHRASGHCPYRAWCAHCISGAANAPAHRARCAVPVGEVPELSYVHVGRFKFRHDQNFLG